MTGGRTWTPEQPARRKLLGGTACRPDRGRHFEGYASLFEVADLGKHVVAAGAFSAPRAPRRRRRPHAVAAVPAEPIGRWLAIAEDAAACGCARAQPRGRAGAGDPCADARRRHRRAVDRLPGRARPHRPRRAAPLERLDLWEISVVTFPMMPGARIGAGKSEALPASSAGRRGACSRPPDASERDDFSSSRHPALPLCLSMIFSENR